MWWIIYLGIFLSLLALLFYKRMTRNFGYFSSRGIPEVEAKFPFGSDPHKQMITGKVSFVSSSELIYKEYKDKGHKFVGHFAFDQPQILITDLDFARDVMIRHFDHFTDRRGVSGLNTGTPVNRLTMSMATMLRGEKWKLLRSLMSPIFTSGKLKSMTGIVDSIAVELSQSLLEKAESGQEFEAKEALSDFTLEVIAACGFGFRAHAIESKENNQFREMVHKLMGQGKRSLTGLLRVLTILSFPKLAHFLKLSFFDPDTINYFTGIIRRTMETRKSEENPRRSKDLVDLALEALKGNVKDEEKDSMDQFEKDAHVTVSNRAGIADQDELETLLVANALQMFMAGYETTSTILAVILYFLAKNPRVQERVQDEIDDLLTGGGSDLDYAAFNDKLPYMEKVIRESSRHYPLTVVERECVKDYRVPGSDFVIPKGMLVQIPSLAFMKDEKYFSADFDPENFSAEKLAVRSPYAYLAFGQGPRNCIGMRFAMLQMKIALTRTLSQFTFKPHAEKTPDQLIPDPLSRSGQPIGGIWIQIERRKKK